MIKNYFKTAWRNIWRTKSFAFINVFGLALGTLCCLYIISYVNEQFQYDKHHNDPADIYRITTFLDHGDRTFNTATSSPPIGPALTAELAAVENYTRVVHTEKLGVPQNLVSYEDRSFYEKEAVLVDSTFFSFFQYQFIEGVSHRALVAPNTVVLTKQLAHKLFGSDAALDKIIQLDNVNGKQDLQVVGVIDDQAHPNHLHAQLFIAMNGNPLGMFVRQDQTWAGNNFVSTYIRLTPGTAASSVESALPQFLEKHGGDQFRSVGMTKTLSLQPLLAIHTDTSFEVDMAETIDPKFLYLLLGIALLIQGVACINFMNLATAQAARRGKEVGIRKVIGAGKSNLVWQFMGESLLLVVLGVLLAMPMLWLALPYLNQLTQSDLSFTLFLQSRTWILVTVIALGTAALAGSYPALYLTAFNPIKVIKGNFSNSISATQIRRILVVSQFVLAIGLITSIIVIREQLRFVGKKDLGFEQHQRLVFSFHTVEAKQQADAFVSGIRQLPAVLEASRTNNYPSQFVFNDRGVFLEGGNMRSSVNAQFMMTDEHFVKANGINLVAGRDFREGDADKVLINETLARQLGLSPETAQGTKLFTEYEPNPAFQVEVTGVIKDFNYSSLHQTIRPFMLTYTDQKQDLSHVVVSVAHDDYTTLLKQLEGVWRSVLPNTPFDYAFMDQQVQQQYQTEQTLASIINAFTMITLLICCMGLFGLAAFSAEQRRKEIGIRKVLGASLTGVVALLSKDFIKLVVIAILIAGPIVWWVMTKWLAGFAYHIDIQWWMFALAGMVAVTIALFTVSWQAIRAAVANPVDSLRDE